MRSLLALLMCLLAGPALALPVVPGAPASPGMDTRAAYGNATNPTVLRVVNLNDSGAGSLRAALEAAGNRVVVFERSGEIVLASDIVVTSPYLTVAGQTAPDPGITVRHYGIQVLTHDVLLQHFRIRKGQVSGSEVCGNNLELYNAATYNIVVDHMSTSWGQDEGIVIYNPSRAANVVIWRSIAAEGLFATPNTGSCGGGGFANGHGIFVYADTTGVTIAQSLMAKNRERNFYGLGGSAVVSLNNVIYGWHTSEGHIWSNADAAGGSGNPWTATVVGNRFIASAGTTESDTTSASMFWYSGNFSPPAGNQIYRVDNSLAVANAHIDVETNQLASIPRPYNPNVMSPPAATPLPAGYVPAPSTATEALVKTNAGARPANRDSVDARLMAEMTARSSSVNFVVYPADVGGWPTLAVNTRALTTPANPNADDNGNGYTNLEDWLHGYALLVEGGPVDNGPVDVPAATGTVVVSALFTGTTGTPLTSYISGTGGTWALQTGSTGILTINANGIMGTSTALSSLTLAAGMPLSAQYDVDVDLLALTVIPGNSYSVWMAATPFTTTGYGFGYDTSSGVWTAFDFVGGVYTELGSCVQPVTAPSVTPVTLRKRTGHVHFVVAGTQCTSANNTDITAPGQAGLSVYHMTPDAPGTGFRFDNFVVRDVTTQVVLSGVPARLRFGTTVH